MNAIWRRITPPLRADDVVKLAIGPTKAKDIDQDLVFNDWEAILSEIIVGDAFGVDRMDYLLRDSHHAGVAYGRFDHYRLIDTLRILPTAAAGAAAPSQEPSLGVEEGGIQSAEALMLARYFMYSQVYFHSIRRIYDIHLMDFLKEWLPHGKFATDLPTHLGLTDNEVTAALLGAAFDSAKPGYELARRIIRREHFKVLYSRNPADVGVNPEAGAAIFAAAVKEFGNEHFRHDRYQQRSGPPDFPVRLRDGQTVSSLAVSDTLSNLPVVSVDYVFADRACLGQAIKWLGKNKDKLIKPIKEGDTNG